MVNFDLRELLNSLVGVVDDVTAESADLSAALESSRQAFSAFTLSYVISKTFVCRISQILFFRYDTARSRVDAILGQKFHPLFPRQRRSCDHGRGCGSYPTTSGWGYGEGVALVMSDGDQVWLYFFLSLTNSLVNTPQVVAPLSGYYSLSPSSSITLSPSENSYHDLTFTLSHIEPTVSLSDTPTFISGGDPLGIITNEPPPQNIDDEPYIHMELYKTVGNETYTLDPSQFLQSIQQPSVVLEYECNDLVTYVGGTVVDRRTLAPDTPEVVDFGDILVEDAIPGHEFARPVDYKMHAQGTIISGVSVELLSSSTFLMVGPIPVEFGEPLLETVFRFLKWLLFVQISEL